MGIIRKAVHVKNVIKHPIHAATRSARREIRKAVVPESIRKTYYFTKSVSHGIHHPLSSALLASDKPRRKTHYTSSINFGRTNSYTGFPSSDDNYWDDDFDEIDPEYLGSTSPSNEARTPEEAHLKFSTFADLTDFEKSLELIWLEEQHIPHISEQEFKALIKANEERSEWLIAHHLPVTYANLDGDTQHASSNSHSKKTNNNQQGSSLQSQSSNNSINASKDGHHSANMSNQSPLITNRRKNQSSRSHANMAFINNRRNRDQTYSWIPAVMLIFLMFLIIFVIIQSA